RVLAQIQIEDLGKQDAAQFAIKGRLLLTLCTDAFETRGKAGLIPLPHDRRAAQAARQKARRDPKLYVQGAHQGLRTESVGLTWTKQKQFAAADGKRLVRYGEHTLPIQK